MCVGCEAGRALGGSGEQQMIMDDVQRESRRMGTIGGVSEQQDWGCTAWKGMWVGE